MQRQSCTTEIIGEAEAEEDGGGGEAERERI